MNSITKKLTLALLLAAVATQPAQAMNWSWKKIAAVTAGATALAGVGYYLWSTYHPENIFLQAAKDKDLETVKKCVVNGVNINVTDHEGYTALHLAAKNNDVPMLRFLIENGMKVNIKTVKKSAWNFYHRAKTPLHIAASYGNTKAIELLVDLGADTNVSDKGEIFEAYPLDDACEAQHMDAAITLIEHGAMIMDMNNLFNFMQPEELAWIKLFTEQNVCTITPRQPTNALFDIDVAIGFKCVKPYLQCHAAFMHEDAVITLTPQQDPKLAPNYFLLALTKIINGKDVSKEKLEEYAKMFGYHLPSSEDNDFIRGNKRSLETFMRRLEKLNPEKCREVALLLPSFIQPSTKIEREVAVQKQYSRLSDLKNIRFNFIKQ